LVTGQPAALAGSPTAPAEVQSPSPKEVAKTPNPAPAPAAGKEPAPK
jgi:hypothetical protein